MNEMSRQCCLLDVESSKKGDGNSKKVVKNEVCVMSRSRVPMSSSVDEGFAERINNAHAYSFLCSIIRRTLRQILTNLVSFLPIFFLFDD